MPDPFFSYFDSDRADINPASPKWLAGAAKPKSYPLSEKINLPEPEKLSGELEWILRSRKSCRDFSGSAISLRVVSNLLFWSAGRIHKDEPDRVFHRSHPSGGAMYPIEIYPVIFAGDGIVSGVYHYDVSGHALERLQDGESESVRSAISYDFARKASMSVVLTFAGRRILEKYGSLGYKLGMIEAGHIAQNIYLVGAALGLGVLALGGGDYLAMERELGLVDSEESILYTLSVGGVSL